MTGSSLFRSLSQINEVESFMRYISFFILYLCYFFKTYLYLALNLYCGFLCFVLSLNLHLEFRMEISYLV